MYASTTLRQDYLSQSQIPFFVKVRLQKTIHLESMTKEPESKVALETRLMTSINDNRYELITPFVLEIRCADDEYIVKSSPIGIFAFGNDPDEAISEFAILLVDYYESLLRKEESLAVNLRKELGILKQYFKKL